MTKSLSTFMALALTAVIISGLLIGLVYQALFNKNQEHENHKTNYQLTMEVRDGYSS